MSMADGRVARGSRQSPVFSSRGTASVGELKTENSPLAGGSVDMVQSGGRRRDACGDALARHGGPCAFRGSWKCPADAHFGV